MYAVQKISSSLVNQLLYFLCYFDCTLKSLKFIVHEAFRLMVALLLLRNNIEIHNSHNPQTSAPDTRVVGSFVTDRPGITLPVRIDERFLPQYYCLPFKQKI